MTDNALSGWMAFLASPAAPAAAMRPLELEGFLTGLAVSPEVIPPSIWTGYIWGEQEPVFDGQERAFAALASVLGYYTFVSGQIENQINGKEPTWLPMYFGKGRVANVEQCAQWVRGFWKATALAPDIWLDLADHPRAQMLIEPFAVFPAFDSDAIDLDIPAEELGEARRMSAEYTRASCQPCASSPKSSPNAPRPRSAQHPRSAVMNPAPVVQAKNTSAAALLTIRNHGGLHRMATHSLQSYAELIEQDLVHVVTGSHREPEPLRHS